MTASDLHTLVLPLIGTACEPEVLRGYAYDCDKCAFMAETMWVDQTFRYLGNRVMEFKPTSLAIQPYEGGGFVAMTGSEAFVGPTRLHALVAAAQKVLGVKG